MRSRVLAFTASLALVAVATTALARNPWEGRPPYGSPIMSKEERQTYRKEIRALSSVEEQEAYWRAHIERMQQRALARGVALPPPPRRLIPDHEQVPRPQAPYFYAIMTDEEREAYYETLGALEDRAERRAFVADHIERMRARGLARGVSLPSTADFADVLEERTHPDTVAPGDDAAELGEDEAELGAESEAFDDEDE
jgi:hypothetical protein